MRELEDHIAEIVERVLRRDEGRGLGPRTRHDYTDGTGWSVDFAYAEAQPPVALEVTSVHDESWLGTASAAEKLARRLSSLIAGTSPDGWEIVISESTNVAALEPELRHVVVRGTSSGLVEDYTYQDLQDWRHRGMLDEELGLRQRLSTLGVTQVRRVEGRSGVDIATVTESGEWLGLADLGAMVIANAEKLKATGLEGHLAIGVVRFAVSSDPTATPVPEFPAGVERVWLIRFRSSPGAGNAVWSACAGATAWTVHEPVTAGPE